MTVRYTFWHYLNRRVTIDGRCVRLKRQENELFFMLYVNEGRPISRDDIIHMLWGDREDGGPLHVWKHIEVLAWSLRQKTGLPIWGTLRPGLVLGYQTRQLIKEQQRAAS